MARNRQRSRRGGGSKAPRPDRRSDDLQQPLRENVPGELDHLSGEVEEVEASLVAGADGEPTELTDDELVAAEEEAEEDLTPARARETAVAGPRPGGNRFLNFLRASWAELQRVQWPDRRHVGQATAVVLGFVAIAGAYLGLADVVAQEIVDLIV